MPLWPRNAVGLMEKQLSTSKKTIIEKQKIEEVLAFLRSNMGVRSATYSVIDKAATRKLNRRKNTRSNNIYISNKLSTKAKPSTKAISQTIAALETVLDQL